MSLNWNVRNINTDKLESFSTVLALVITLLKEILEGNMAQI